MCYKMMEAAVDAWLSGLTECKAQLLSYVTVYRMYYAVT